MTAAAEKKLKCHSLSNEISFQSTDNKTKYNLTFEKGVVSLQRNKIVRFRPHNFDLL